MLLIIFLGLIAKLTLVSGNCDVGTRFVKNFDFIRYTGTWYVLMHTPNDIENKLDCFICTCARPEGNISLITIQARVISENRRITVYANATNWNSNGWEDIFNTPSIWNGRYYVIAVDYERYKILKHCSVETNQLYIYVAYRSNPPDEATVKDVMKELQKNNIDVRQLAKWPADHCQQAESSTEEED